MKSRLEQAVEVYWKAAEEVEAAAAVTKADVRSKFPVITSRLLRGRLLDAQIRGARAERYVLAVPMEQEVKQTK